MPFKLDLAGLTDLSFITSAYMELSCNYQPALDLNTTVFKMKVIET